MGKPLRDGAVHEGHSVSAVLPSWGDMDTDHMTNDPPKEKDLVM